MMEPSCKFVIVGWLWLFVIHATLLVSPAVESIIATEDPANATDALTLLSFKQQISNDPFHSLSTWNYSLPFCQWHGITCSRRHPPRVVAMNLAGLQVVGTLSPSIANLTWLRKIDLSHNELHGQIPQELGRLFRLRYLNLSYNSLGGEIPANLSGCGRLRTIDFILNELTGRIPVELGGLSRLNRLYLGGNNLTGSIPTSFGNLSSLTHLGLGSNQLEGNIPKELGQVRSLFLFSVQVNRISGTIPSTFYNLSSMAFFSVVVNQLSGSLPPDLGVTLPNLIGLHVGGNRFTGPIPISLSNASRLEELELSSNQFSGSIPMNLGTLGGLRLLNLENNMLGSGEVEDMGSLSSLANCSLLQILSVTINQLTGLIPEYLEKLRHLQYLNLSYNNFVGEVPQEGIFKNASAISVIGNKKLCGGSPALLLPACPSQDSEKQRRRFSRRRLIAIVIGSIICSVFLSSFLFYYYIRKSKKKHPHPDDSIMNPLEEQLQKISYGDLSRATDGFSQANLIGVGSYGSVYKGHLDSIEKIVAVKVLNLQRQGAFKSFIAECRALKNIRHRNLLKIQTVCSSIDFKGDDFKALVFDYMANGNLEQWLHPSMDKKNQSKNLTLIQRLNIAVDVASALNYLHNSCDKSIVHCDLKPSNILLDDDMNAHVGDFGLARFLSEATSSCSQSHTNSRSIKGTIGYLAPEYGMGGQASTFGDIYSYGILLLEMFIGKKPTDEIFNGSLSLHQFAKMALPERVMEIADQRLLSIEAEALNESQTPTNAESKLEMCLVSTFKIGVACSTISIKDRMAIGDATVEMLRIRNSYLGVGIHARNN